MISAGAIFNGDNRIKAYGTVNKTLKAGTPIKDYEFDSKIGFVYSGLIKGNENSWVFASPLYARQNLAEPKTSVGTYYEQHKRMPGDNDAGFFQFTVMQIEMPLLIACLNQFSIMFCQKVLL